MKSRITIEVDFENGNQPVLQILHRKSSDVRDSLLSQFLQQLEHSSRWCRILFDGKIEDHDGATWKWKIEPIPTKDLSGECSLMYEMIQQSYPSLPIKS